MVYFIDFLGIKNLHFDTKFKGLRYWKPELWPTIQIHDDHGSHLGFDILLCNITIDSIFNLILGIKNLHFDTKFKGLQLNTGNLS